MSKKTDQHKVQKSASKRSKKRSQQSATAQIVKSIEWKDYLSWETFKTVVGALLFIIALFLIIAMVSNVFTGQMDQASLEAGQITHPANYAGRWGAVLAFYFQDKLFGLCSIFIPIFVVVVALKCVSRMKIRLWKWFVYLALFMVWGSVTLSYASAVGLIPIDWLDAHIAFRLGGMHGDEICALLIDNVGALITAAILGAVALAYLFFACNDTYQKLKSSSKKAVQYVGEQLHAVNDEEEMEEEDIEEEDAVSEEGASIIDLTPCEEEDEVQEEIDETAETVEEEPAEVIEEPEFEVEAAKGDKDNPSGALEAETEDEPTDISTQPPFDPRATLSRYKYPVLSLLDRRPSSNAIDMEEQKANKDNIIRVLRSFGVEISAIKATVGPTVTLYEITPAEGVRISKIRNLEDDIALSLAALGIRIIAPIPGKGTIGIEVPNKNPQAVPMESILNSKVYQETKYELPIALGKTITNDVFMVDLAKMPHLLVAGATGQGKSVGLNALITSLLYKKHPSELKLVMVDPKKVEFSMYNPLLKHFLAQVPDGDEPVITDVQKVVQTLKSLCCEMDQRYDLLKMAHCKNIKEYNAKFCQHRLNPQHGHRYLPYIVVIIDEFGDLIMTAGKEVELPIARIAQLARAVGIHMVIATQSPRATIITGKIKANFPGRIAFRVAQGVESQTILDRRGANQLIGKGDMLFLQGSQLVRVQCAFVDTPEVERITEYISNQQGYPEPYILPEVQTEDGDGSGSSADDIGRLDTKFREVAQFVVSRQQGSTSSIQRAFEIGYNRAGRIMDQLEKVGVVGPAQGAKPREVLVQDLMRLDDILDGLGC